METLKLSIAKQGRAGKTVTVIRGFTRDRHRMEPLVSGWKKAIGCGGSWEGQTVELQGDVRDRLRPRLLAEGFQVKG